MSLLDFARNDFSQNGEDGVIERIFSIIGETTRICCEFGAWDGIHLSNTRSLILRGWRAVLIEAEADRFAELESTYADNPAVRSVHACVGEDVSLGQLLVGTPRLDLLSVDIDGLDYEILAKLDIEPPRVICIEVSTGHDPVARGLLPREIAARNVGQPFAEIAAVAADKGYRLVAFTGNAFFVHRDVGHEAELPTRTSVEAHGEALARVNRESREWLYLLNLGLVNPYYTYNNRHLRARALGIGSLRALRLRYGRARDSTLPWNLWPAVTRRVVHKRRAERG